MLLQSKFLKFLTVVLLFSSINFLPHLHAGVREDMAIDTRIRVLEGLKIHYNKDTISIGIAQALKALTNNNSERYNHHDAYHLYLQVNYNEDELDFSSVLSPSVQWPSLYVEFVLLDPNKKEIFRKSVSSELFQVVQINPLEGVLQEDQTLANLSNIAAMSIYENLSIFIMENFELILSRENQYDEESAKDKDQVPEPRGIIGSKPGVDSMKNSFE